MAKILISGGSGLIGKAITRQLLVQGHEVVWTGRTGGQGLPWQRLQSDREDVQGNVQGGQADQAQGFTRQVLRDFFGGHGLDACESMAYRAQRKSRE